MRRFLAASAIALLTAAGCSTSPDPLKRGAIRGQITLDGKPVPKANVRFIALGPDGINVLAIVTNGTFEVPEGQGPVKGRYRIEFSVPTTYVRRTPNPDVPGKWLEEPGETLPSRYHKDSNYILDYDPADAKPYNADLTSK